MKVYVASSWRNEVQPSVVVALRQAGHEVYDFRHPHQTSAIDRGRAGQGFHWGEIDPNWENWSIGEYRNALGTDIASDGFHSDMDALEWCDVCVMVQPCGRSAALELGWAAGAGKEVMTLLAEGQEPELMLLMSRLCLSIEEVLRALQ